MSIRIVRLGTPREAGEGLRLGTVRRPPRGVPKAEYAIRDFFDVWLPNLAPSAPLMAEGKAVESEEDWLRFARRYRAEMESAENSKVLDLLVAFSRHSNFSVGCYCDNERRCHRSLLRQLLTERGAEILADEQGTATRGV